MFSIVSEEYHSKKINTRIQTRLWRKLELQRRYEPSRTWTSTTLFLMISWESMVYLKDSDSNVVVLTRRRFLMLHHFEKWFRNEYCVRSRRDDALLQYRWQKLRRSGEFFMEEVVMLWLKIRQRRSRWDVCPQEVACSITRPSGTHQVQNARVSRNIKWPPRIISLDSSIPTCISMIRHWYNSLEACRIQPHCNARDTLWV